MQKPTLTHSLKRVARRAIDKAGISIQRTAEITPYAPDIRHAAVIPAASYSPWLSDAEFKATYEQIHAHTLVDRYRAYELWQLVEEVAELPDGDILEVGVWRGGTAAILAQKASLVGITAPIYLCDTFKGVVKAGLRDGAYIGGEHADTTKQTVITLLRRMQLEQNVRILEGIFPDESAQEIEGRTFRLCHIDVDVYESAKHITEWIWPRLVTNGAIVYDDYGFHNCIGITQLVNEERMRPGRLVIHNLNGHAIVIKTT